MKTKKPLLNSSYGNRGFIFSLDITIAIIIVILILITSTYYVSRIDERSFSKIQMIRTGNDILVVMDQNGILQTLNKELIENEMKLLLPINYDMKVKITCSSLGVETSSSLPYKKFVASGKRVLVRDNLENCVTKHWVWLR